MSINYVQYLKYEYELIINTEMFRKSEYYRKHVTWKYFFHSFY